MDADTVKWRLITLAGLLFLLFHFVMTLVYSLPDVKVPESFRQTSNNYMVPWFHQGWQLFAPDVPKYQVFLRYRVPQDGQWGQWQHLQSLDSLRGHSRIHYISKKIGNVLMHDLARNSYLDDNGIRQYDNVTPAMPYLRCLYFVVRYHEKVTGIEPDSIQMGLDIHFAPDYHTREVKPISKFDFPTYHLHE